MSFVKFQILNFFSQIDWLSHSDVVHGAKMKNTQKGIVILLSSALLVIPSHQCKIQGTESGVCTYRYLPSTYQDGIRSNLEAIGMASQNWANGTDGPCRDGQADHCMPFCGRYIANYYPPCVPNNGVALERDQNFPNGRFQDHTTRAKDRWIEEQATSIIENRIEKERRKQSERRFYKNKACQVRILFSFFNGIRILGFGFWLCLYNTNMLPSS